MAISDHQSDEPQNPNLIPPIIDDDDEDDDADDQFEQPDDDEFDEEEEDENELHTDEPPSDVERAKMTNLFRRIAQENVPLRVHSVSIHGFNKTKESVIEREIEFIKSAKTIMHLILAAYSVNEQLRRSEIFDFVQITLDPGPPEFAGTANVIVQVVECKYPVTAGLGVFGDPEARSGLLEGSLKLKNLFGYGDLWDGSLNFGWDQISEVSAGLSLPRSTGVFAFTPMARVSLLSPDLLKMSSYKDQLLGLSYGMSFGLLTSTTHDITYNFSWRKLQDPSEMSSVPVWTQFTRGLNSAVKYTYKVDKRNSPLRPTRGYAFQSATQFGGPVFDCWRSGVSRQDFDIRCALPLGFCNAALNFGVASSAVFPWGSRSVNTPSCLPDGFSLGRNTSAVCSLRTPAMLLGFKSWGLGLTEPRTEFTADGGSSDASSRRDFRGGDLAVTAFADLSFDLPLRVLREAGIHGHTFACSGSLNKLTENTIRDFSFPKLRDSFRSSVGLGIVIPTRLFRMEVNYCYLLKKQEHDQGKSGLQFSISLPL